MYGHSQDIELVNFNIIVDELCGTYRGIFERRIYVADVEELNTHGITALTGKPFTGQKVLNIMGSVKR